MTKNEAMRQFFQQPAPDGYLAAWSQRLAEPEVAKKTEDMGVLVLQLASEYVAWRAASCLTILPTHPVHAVPHRHHPALCGVVALSGTLIPCISLAHLLRVSSSQNQESCALMLVGDEEHPIAMLVDAVVSYMRVHHQDVQPLPDSMAATERYDSESMLVWQERSIPLLSDAQVLLDAARCMQA